MKLTDALPVLLFFYPAFAADTCGLGRPTSDEIEECAGRLAEKAEAALSRTFELVREQLIDKRIGALDSDLVTLQESQKTWLSYEEVQCDFEYEQAHIGTLRNAAQLFCMQRMAEARTKELAGYAQSK